MARVQPPPAVAAEAAAVTWVGWGGCIHTTPPVAACRPLRKHSRACPATATPPTGSEVQPGLAAACCRVMSCCTTQAWHSVPVSHCSCWSSRGRIDTAAFQVVALATEEEAMVGGDTTAGLAGGWGGGMRRRKRRGCHFRQRPPHATNGVGEPAVSATMVQVRMAASE
jgi:hypothetical protein